MRPRPARLRRWWGATLGVLVLAAVLVAAGRARAETFVFAWPAEPVLLDPAVVVDGVSLGVTQQIFETLVRFRGATTELAPGLARSWDASPDGTVWTLHLRRGVRFHDGTPLDAAAVVWNFERWWRTGHPQHAAQLRAGRTFEYWAAQFGGFDDEALVAAVEAVDAHTVRVTLKAALGPFLANLAIPGFGIASPAAAARWAGDFGKHPVGSGPFRFVEWRPGERVVLEANPGYWGPAPRVSRVVARAIKENAGRLAALRAGEVHAIEGLAPDDVAAVQADPALRFLPRPANDTGYVAFNFRVREFRDRRVRQAFAHAIDRAALVAAFYGGSGVVATQFQPPTLWGHDPALRGHPHDPARARALLAEAGFPAGLDAITWEDGRREPLALWYMPVSRPYFPNPRDIAQAIAADLARAGIQARPSTVDWATYLDRVQAGRLPLYMLGWIGDNGDPDNCLCYVFCTPGAPSQGFYANPQVAALLLQARGRTVLADRAPLYRRAERLLHDDVARLFVAHARMPLAVSARVRGYEPHPLGVESFARVELR